MKLLSAVDGMFLRMESARTSRGFVRLRYKIQKTKKTRFVEGSAPSF